MAELDSDLVAPTSTADVDTPKGLRGKEVATGFWVWAPEAEENTDTDTKLYKFTSATFGQAFPEVVTQDNADAFVVNPANSYLKAGDTVWVDVPSGHVYQFDVRTDSAGTTKVAAHVEYSQPTGVSYTDIANVDPADFPAGHAITTTVGESAGGWINNATSTAWIRDDASTNFSDPTSGSTIDSVLNDASVNAVENQVVTNALNLKAEHAQEQNWTKAQAPVAFAAPAAGQLTAGESHYQTTTLTVATELSFSGVFKAGTNYTLEVTSGGNALTVNATNDVGKYTQPARAVFLVYITVMGDGTPVVIGAA